MSGSCFEKVKKNVTEKAYRMDKVDNVVRVIFTALTVLAVAATAYIMLNTFVNIISRVVFSKSINGSVQTSQIVLSLVAMCSIPVVTMYNTHIKVDLVADKLPPKGQDILTCINLVLCSAMMVFMGYYTFIKAGKAMQMGLSMDVPAFPHWPIYDLIAVMLIVSAVCALYNLVHFMITGTLISAFSFDEVKERLKARKAAKGGEEV